MNEDIMQKVKDATDAILKADPEMQSLQETVQKQVQALMQDGATFAELKGISDEQLEAVYSVGFNFYQSGRYEEAEKVFKALVVLDFYKAKYVFAYASTLQAQRQFEPATRAYAMATVLDAEDPRPLYHTAECLLALGDREQALAALEMIETLSVGKDERSRNTIAKAARLKAKLEG